MIIYYYSKVGNINNDRIPNRGDFGLSKPNERGERPMIFYKKKIPII